MPAKDDARCGIRVRAVRAEMDFHFRLLEGASPTAVHGRMRRFARTPRSPSGEIENTLQLPMRPANAVPMMVEACIMKGDPRIIELLNEVLTSELTAINQYFIHYKMLENWGYKRLAHVKKKESIEEMHHADEVISRILYLEGVPNMQRLSPIKVGETIKEIHEVDLSLEQNAVERLNRAVLVSTQVGDNGSRILFEKILKEEEDAIDWLETHLGMLAQLGETAYLAEMIGEVD